MPINLNDAGPQQQPAPAIDWDSLSAALARRAQDWVPRLFPRGRIDENGNVRCANIYGDPPRKTGSCIIYTRGEYPGSWTEWDRSVSPNGGGPLSTIKEATGLGGAELIEYVDNLIGGIPDRAIASEKRLSRDSGNEVRATLAGAVDLAGTLGQTYLNSRGITRLPTRDDVKFNPTATDWAKRRATPTIVAVFRRLNQEPSGGIHRIPLTDDGTGHGEKRMLGPCDECVVMLDDPIDGTIGMGEGIETTAAAGQIFDVPVWSAGSVPNMIKFADNVESMGALALGIKRVLVFADRHTAGEHTGLQVCQKIRRGGAEAYFFLPRSDDDFAKDLETGEGQSRNWEIEVAVEQRGTALPGSTQEIIEPPRSFDQISAAINAMYDGANIFPMIDMIAVSDLHSSERGQLVNLLKRKTGMPPATLNKAIVDRQREIKGGQLVGQDGAAPWQQMLDIPEDSKTPRGSMANVLLALRGAPDWQLSDGKSILAMNEFSGMMVLRGLTPHERLRRINRPEEEVTLWTDAQEIAATEWIQQNGIPAQRWVVSDGIRLVAEENAYHPIREWLDSLKWDRRARLDSWLTYCCGVEDSRLVQACGARWLIGAVARIYVPGCQMDTALILEGEQGIGKSSVFRILGGQWFTDEIADFGSKDAALQMRGAWMIEFSELDSMQRAEVSRIKKFLTQTMDRYRPPYGKAIVEQPRASVFCGSCNENEYLRDASGGRRFWPFWSTRIDLDSLRKEREQMLAEAVYRFKNGEKWWLHEPHLIQDAAVEQGKRYQHDPWEPVIQTFLQNKLPGQTTTTPEIFWHALEIHDRARWSKPDQMRITAIFRRLDWIATGSRSGASRERTYIRRSDSPLGQAHRDDE